MSSALLVCGCYSSHVRSERVTGDAGLTDAARRDAGPLPNCDELFARTPDVVNDSPYTDLTCTETTFPLALSYLDIWSTGGEPILRSCFVVTHAHAASGWTTGQMVSEDGPGVRVRVAGPSQDPADERVLWDARAIDAAGRVIAGRAESLRIGRAIPTAFGAHADALASIVPSLWASEGQVNAGLYGHPASGGWTLRRAALGATWFENGTSSTFFEWVYPDEQVHALALPDVPLHATVVDWLDGSQLKWRLLDGNRMTMVSAPTEGSGAMVLEGVRTLPGVALGEALSYADGRVFVLEAGTVLAFSALDGSPLGTFATGVRALLPTAVLHDDGRLETLAGGEAPTVYALEDVVALGRTFAYIGDGVLVGQAGVAGSAEIDGPHFVPYENVGVTPGIRTATVNIGAFADVLYDEPSWSSRAQRLALSFRGCD